MDLTHALVGENTHKVYRLGDKVRVQVIRVNMEMRQVDLGLAEILERVREGERGSRRSKSVPKVEAAQAASGSAGTARPQRQTLTTKTRRSRRRTKKKELPRRHRDTEGPPRGSTGVAKRRARPRSG
jgi:ribonuclease R